MQAEISHVTQPSQVETVAQLAHNIWNEHYLDIIGQGQIDYMLEQFQSPAAIAAQIVDGYKYYLVSVEGQAVGYFALGPASSDERVQLSKIYIAGHYRGHGLGRAAMQFAEQQAGLMGGGELWLTVNRHNAGSIAFYERLGFLHQGTLILDIGGGFVMDDYRMAKPVGCPAPRRGAR